MKRANAWSSAAVALACPLVVACATGGITTGEEIREEMDLPPYNGPKATIAVGPCEDRSGGSANFSIGDGDQQIQYSFTSTVGHGMADMFVTGLLNTDRFRVLETGAVEALEQEQRFQGDEVGRGMAGADLLLTCAVTSVEPDAGGVGGAIASLGGSLLGVGAGGLKRSTVELDVRVIDVETREILTGFTADGTATDAGALGLLGGGSTIGGLGAYSNTPIEGAVKKAIRKATEHLARNVDDYVSAVASER